LLKNERRLQIIKERRKEEEKRKWNLRQFRKKNENGGGKLTKV
jgi:ribosome recycling factor